MGRQGKKVQSPGIQEGGQKEESQQTKTRTPACAWCGLDTVPQFPWVPLDGDAEYPGDHCSDFSIPGTKRRFHMTRSHVAAGTSSQEARGNME